MKILSPVNKTDYLENNYPFYPVPELTDKKHCTRCGNDITVGEFKVGFEGGEQFIVCPNAPECKGNVFDWRSLGWGSSSK
jgi:hypothetical protein